jgi:hypothetical protein
MHKATKRLLASLAALCMVPAFGQALPDYSGWRYVNDGATTRIVFGSNGTALPSNFAPVGSPGVVGNFGLQAANDGVYLKSSGAVPVPTTGGTVPINGKLKLTGAALAKALARGAFAVSGAQTLWQAGNELFDIWTNFGLKACPQGVCEPQSSTATVTQWWFHNGPSGSMNWPTSTTGFRDSVNKACERGYQVSPTQWSAPYSVGPITTSVVNQLPSSPQAGKTQTYHAICMRQVYDGGGKWYTEHQTYVHAFYTASQTSSYLETALTEQQLIDKIARESGWPDSSALALQRAMNSPASQEVSDIINAQPESNIDVDIGGAKNVQIGEPQVQTSQSTNAQGEPLTTTTTQTTTATVVGNQIRYQTTTNTQTVNNTTNQTVTNNTYQSPSNFPNTGTGTTPQGDIQTCGLPDTPPCKIDESGSALPDEVGTVQQDAQTALARLQACIDDIEACVPALPSLNWTFSFPTGCSVIPTPAFAPYMTGIDVCQFQPQIHDILSMLWAAAGLFGAVGMVFRDATGS